MIDNIDSNSILSPCNLCERRCNVRRDQSELGYCNMPSELKLARAALHMWEEPCISGSQGSGTVFFSGCSLRCVFCQNNSIANGTTGKTITISRLADIFLELEQKGAHNINLVTPTHYVPAIIKALDRSMAKGLSIPIVYNTGSYETIETLKLLEGYIDIYLPDLKYKSRQLSKKYSNAEDYFLVATKAIEEMYRQVKTPQFEDGLIKKGMIVRHLVLPGQTRDSKEIIKYLYDTYKDNIFISILNQYTPLAHVSNYTELNRTITEKEYDKVVNYAIDLGIEQGFIQEGETYSESFIPPFNYEGL